MVVVRVVMMVVGMVMVMVVVMAAVRADALDVMMMALLRRAEVALEADHLRAVLA